MDSSTRLQHDTDEQQRSEQTLVGQTLASGFGLLRFPEALEQRFHDDLSERRLRVLRLSAWGAAVASAGMLMADYFLLPDVLALAFVLRVLVFGSVCLLAIWLVPRYFGPAAREWALAPGGVLAVVICLTLIMASDSTWAEPALVTLNVVVVYSVTAGRFWPSVAVCVVAALGHFQSLAVIQGPWDAVPVPATLLLATSIGYSLYCNYRLEYRERLSYLLDLQEQALQAQLQAANEQLARTARTDALTEVANRRHFDEFLAQVWEESARQGSAVALLLLDIDHFKAYNDRYGHQAGDRCLCTVAQAVAACLRKSGDLVARWGGEEFAVVMSGTTLEVAMLAAERVRQAVVACGLLHTGSTSAPVVTVSIGVAGLAAGQALPLADLVRQADAALYRAKAAGRNRVVCLDTQPASAGAPLATSVS